MFAEFLIINLFVLWTKIKENMKHNAMSRKLLTRYFVLVIISYCMILLFQYPPMEYQDEKKEKELLRNKYSGSF